MNILDKALRLLEQPLCDSCLGRQFGQLLHGYTNSQRGAVLRKAAAMAIDKEKLGHRLDMSNFSDIRFHFLASQAGISAAKKKKCSLCHGLFDNLDAWIDKAIQKTRNREFSRFLVGTKLSFDLIRKEEDLWERVGIDYCEPMKAEINREIGKAIEKKINKKFDGKTPDVNVIINIDKGNVFLEVNPLFIYGEYKKLKRGIPQTKWPSGKYKTSIEQIVAKPFMKATKGKGHKFHGAGREDIDARCLDWRPFVLEILEPEKRAVNFAKINRRIAKKVQVRKMRFSGINEVRAIKEMKHDKTYRVLVECGKPVEKKNLKKLKKLKGLISQRTPRRVIHRRGDLLRRKKIAGIKTKFINARKFYLIARCQAGLYIKELVTGDEGRTRPSVAEVLEIKCIPKDLDVIKIHR